MRIVATSDTHYPPFVRRLDMMLNTVWDPTIPIPDGDVFIHAGDLMRMGYPDEWGPAVEWLARLPHKHKSVCIGQASKRNANVGFALRDESSTLGVQYNRRNA